MVERYVEVPSYSSESGLAFEWEEGFILNVSVDSSELLIRANRAGLVSIARHLLTLSQNEVPNGSHLHLTAGQEVDGDFDLIFQVDDDGALLEC